MAITVPVAGTMVDANTFGAPVANALNLLTPPRVIAGKAQSVSQPGKPSGAWSSVTGISVTFTAKPTWCYLVGWQANLSAGPTASLWMNAGVSIDGATPSVLGATAISAAAGGAQGYGVTCGGMYFYTSKLSGAFAAGSHTLQLQTTSAGAAHDVDAGTVCYVYVVDFGSDI